ncbi:MAG: acetate--CoA ligase family protein [Thermodesulfobacteriota bacterium]
MDNRFIERIVKEAMSLGKKALAEPEAKEILRACGIPVPRFKVVKDVTGAIEAASEIGYPVVLKLVSADIAHKSDVGGVAMGIKDDSEIEERWSRMILGVAMETPTAMIEGFLIEEMVPRGVEVITGVIKDEQFGPVAMFGTGGVSVELMKDVSFRLSPIDEAGALEMMGEVKGWPLLRGFRGDTPRDVSAVADIIVKLTRVVEETDGLTELEINPLVVYEKGVMAVDARAALA